MAAFCAVRHAARHAGVAPKHVLAAVGQIQEPVGVFVHLVDGGKEIAVYVAARNATKAS
jgi:hypothetical protein